MPYNNTKEFIDETTTFMQGDGISVGIICMWSGLLNNIPIGWILCDGSNGTPDLRNSFIKSVGTGEDPGAGREQPDKKS